MMIIVKRKSEEEKKVIHMHVEIIKKKSSCMLENENKLYKVK
jgi:hypothetical protein